MKHVENNPQYKAFEDLLNRVIQVPHSEIKAKLDAEKREKQKPKTSDASREDGDND